MHPLFFNAIKIFMEVKHETLGNVDPGISRPGTRE